MGKPPPTYYLVLDLTGPKSREIWRGYANNPKEACRLADIAEHGNKRSKLFDLAVTLHADDAIYTVVECNAFTRPITPELTQNMHKFDHFKRVKIKRFPWLGKKIWAIIIATVGALVTFILKKFLP